MRIAVRCFALLRELAAPRLEVELAAPATVADAWDALAARHPDVAEHRPFALAARNGAYAAWDDELDDGDEVAFLPPVSGGGGAVIEIGIVAEPIDAAALERGVAGTGDGALVTFVGRARDHADDGRTVVELEYEVYPEMARHVLAEIAGEVAERHGARVSVVHRTGVVALGEAAVVIVAAAPHRAEAFAACRDVIEAIKQRLPIWKRERFLDGSEWKRPGA